MRLALLSEDHGPQHRLLQRYPRILHLFSFFDQGHFSTTRFYHNNSMWFFLSPLSRFEKLGNIKEDIYRTVLFFIQGIILPEQLLKNFKRNKEHFHTLHPSEFVIVIASELQFQQPFYGVTAFCTFVRDMCSYGFPENFRAVKIYFFPSYQSIVFLFFLKDLYRNFFVFCVLTCLGYLILKKK